MKAVLLVLHGSHSPETLKEVQQLVETLQSRNADVIFEYAFYPLEQFGIFRCADLKKTREEFEKPQQATAAVVKKRWWQ